FLLRAVLCEIRLTKGTFFLLFLFGLTITTYHLAIPKLFFTSSFFSISAIIVLPSPSKVTFRRILALSFHSPFSYKWGFNLYRPVSTLSNQAPLTKFLIAVWLLETDKSTSLATCLFKAAFITN